MHLDSMAFRRFQPGTSYLLCSVLILAFQILFVIPTNLIFTVLCILVIPTALPKHIILIHSYVYPFTNLNHEPKSVTVSAMGIRPTHAYRTQNTNRKRLIAEMNSKLKKKLVICITTEINTYNPIIIPEKFFSTLNYCESLL